MSPTAYVYLHCDPRDGEVRYVGMGRGGRAWQCSTSPKARHYSGLHSSIHHAWLCSLFDLGYTMGDIVKVVAQGIPMSDARVMESELILEHDPARLFNIQTNANSLVLSVVEFRQAQELRMEGMSYFNIGVNLGVSTMTAYRALNNQTRGYQINEFSD